MSDAHNEKPWGYAESKGRPLGWVADRQFCNSGEDSFLTGNYATEEEARKASDLAQNLYEDAELRITGKKLENKTPTDEGPAFPIQGTDQHSSYFGLTVRDYFAGQAMQGLTCNRGIIGYITPKTTQCVATWSVMLADALIAELEKPRE